MSYDWGIAAALVVPVSAVFSFAFFVNEAMQEPAQEPKPFDYIQPDRDCVHRECFGSGWDEDRIFVADDGEAPWRSLGDCEPGNVQYFPLNGNIYRIEAMSCGD